MATKLLSLESQRSAEAVASWNPSVEQLGAFLDEVFGDAAVVLHDRKMSAGDQVIDHLVIASSGVWVIDAQRGDDATLIDALLNVGTTDVAGRQCLRAELIDSIQARCGAVASLLEPMGLRSVPVHPVLCVTEPEWSRNSKADVIDDVLVLSPDKLRSVGTQPGWLHDETIVAIATRVRSGLAAHPVEPR